MDYVTKKILQKPENLLLEDVEADELLTANDLFYTEDKTVKGWLSWSLGLLFIFGSLIGFAFDYEEEPTGRIIFILALIIPGIFFIIYGFIAPSKKIIMDRLNNKITIPRHFMNPVNIIFETSFGLIRYINSSPGVISGILILRSNKKKPKVEGKLASHKDIDDYWNFTIWYMDKNRPLPPGTAFDPYREKDFERRKSEGFPKPLYPSNITTNEATREQQKERELIGGW